MHMPVGPIAKLYFIQIISGINTVLRLSDQCVNYSQSARIMQIDKRRYTGVYTIQIIRY